MPILSRQQIRTVEANLYHYEAIKKDVQEWKSDLMGLKARPEVVTGQGYYSDTVRKTVERLDDPPGHIKSKMVWIRAIDTVADKIKGTTGESVLHAWYRAPRQTIEEACEKAHISRQCFIQWRERIVMGVALYAIFYSKTCDLSWMASLAN